MNYDDEEVICLFTILATLLYTRLMVSWDSNNPDKASGYQYTFRKSGLLTGNKDRYGAWIGNEYIYEDRVEWDMLCETLGLISLLQPTYIHMCQETQEQTLV